MDRVCSERDVHDPFDREILILEKRIQLAKLCAELAALRAAQVEAMSSALPKMSALSVITPVVAPSAPAVSIIQTAQVESVPSALPDVPAASVSTVVAAPFVPAVSVVAVRTGECFCTYCVKNCFYC